jgi:hypothetical protein
VSCWNSASESSIIDVGKFNGEESRTNQVRGSCYLVRRHPAVGRGCTGSHGRQVTNGAATGRSGLATARFPGIVTTPA